MKFAPLFGIVLLAAFAVVVAGCVQPDKIYVCSDGTQVADFRLCTGGTGPTATPGGSIAPTATPAANVLKAFGSWDEATAYLAEVSANTGGSRGGIYANDMMVKTATAGAPMAAPSVSGEASGQGVSATDYSSTNVQVVGVDEADKTKNDGKYIYTITGGHIAIVDAFPADSAKLVYLINESGVSYSSLFVNGDKLVAIGSGQYDWSPITIMAEKETGVSTVGTVASAVAGKVGAAIGIMPPRYPGYYYGGTTIVKVFDVTDRANPKEIKNVTFQGNNVAARMIGSNVYTIYSSSAGRIPRPIYMVDGAFRSLSPQDVGFVPCRTCYSQQFTTILGLNLDNLAQQETREIVLAGYGQTVYVSQDTAYVTYTGNGYEYKSWQPYLDVLSPLPEDVLKDFNAVDAFKVSDNTKDNLKMQVLQDYVDGLSEADYQTTRQALSTKQQEYNERVQSSEETVVHKFSLANGTITYEGKGSAPGHLLNQYSLDENALGQLRLATTKNAVYHYDYATGAGGETTPQTSGIYVLDNQLKLVGKVEGLAPKENFHSARFMGDRAYLVTFMKTDPLFVVSFDAAGLPKLEGQLKIPGYSDYLHPYGDKYLIGLGKDAVPAEKGQFGDSNFAWYQGVKLSLFDVSDVTTPKEVASYKIGDRGTDSVALYDPHAFTFSASKGLLVVPVALSEINPAKYPSGVEPNTYGDFTFQGAYVFNVTEAGFTLRGRVSHTTPEEMTKMGSWYWNDGTGVDRSLWMDNVLYTVSQKLVKANNLGTLADISTVALPYWQDYGPIVY